MDKIKTQRLETEKLVREWFYCRESLSKKLNDRSKTKGKSKSLYIVQLIEKGLAK